jgi:hypothetical protein
MHFMHRPCELVKTWYRTVKEHDFVIFSVFSGARRRTPSAQTTAIRREGNVHRLTDRRDPDDDENNTWNGNSTQQM